MATAVDRVSVAFGHIDCVVNNAGLGGAFGPVTELEAEDWDYTFGVLTRGVFLGIKHGARAMEAQGDGGSIVNMASLAGLSGGSGPQAYSAAKAAVINLSQTTAVELAASMIRVNTICPGLIRTPSWPLGRRPDQVEAVPGQIQPWPEPGRAEDVAGAIAFLVGPDSGFITGHTLVVDGGQTAAGALEPNRRLRRALSRRALSR